MDGSRFDAWTRRRFGLAAGGLAGSLLSLIGIGPDDAQARKGKKKKRRCKKLGQPCKPTGKRKCCKGKGLACYPPVEGPGGRRCCLRGQESCKTDDECCHGTCTDNLCACKTNGMPCGGVDELCCSLSCSGDGGTTCGQA